MSRIDREYKKAVEEEKKTEAQIKALQLHLEETAIRRQQLAREALVKAFENKKLGRDEFFDVVEGISSGRIDFLFSDEDEIEDEETESPDNAETNDVEDTLDHETEPDISGALSRAFAETALHEYEGGEQDA